MKKSECTPEQWAAYRAYQREYYWKNHERVLQLKRVESLTPEQAQRQRDRVRSYNAREDRKAYRRQIDAAPKHVARRYAYNQTPEHKSRAKERMKHRYQRDPTLRKRRNDYGRWLRTGFTPTLVEELRELQGDRCAVCERLFSEAVKMHADHCYTEKKPRGLLCFQCNIIEGKLLSIGLTAVQFSERLQRYLENPPAKLCKSFKIQHFPC